MIPIDPIVAERVGYNAGKSIDRLAKVALDTASVTYDDATTSSIQEIGSSTEYLNSYLLQEGVSLLEEANVRPFGSEAYVLVVSPKQAQHLKAENTNQGWRYLTARNEGMGMNS